MCYQFGKKLRNGNYDIFFVLPPSFSSAWMSFISKIPERIGYAGQFRSILFTNVKKHEKEYRTQHIHDEYLNLLASDLQSENYPPNLVISKQWVETNLNSFRYQLPKSFFVLSPGAIFGPSKQWPIKYFRSLALKLNDFFKTSIIVTGTKEDFEYGEEISNGLEYISNFCGETSLSELLAILSKAQLLIGNDSGSMHLMSTLKRPQIAIFGSTSPIWTSPINPNALILSKDLNCSPCFKRTCQFGHYDCMTKITPELVFQASKNILSVD